MTSESSEDDDCPFSEDDFRSGCRNVSQQQEFFSELPSPGRSHYTNNYGHIADIFFLLPLVARDWIRIFAPLDPWEEEGSESELFPYHSGFERIHMQVWVENLFLRCPKLVSRRNLEE